jgi:hypothetical protein
MTKIKEKAFELLRGISDEKAVYVIKFIQAIEDESDNTQDEIQYDDSEKRKASFKAFSRFKETLPLDFDYKKELAEARDEKYGCVD